MPRRPDPAGAVAAGTAAATARRALLPWGPYARQVVKLATPIALSRLTIMMMAMIDIAMVGHFAGEELGAQAAGSALAGTIMLVVFGLVTGVQVHLAQAFGRGEAGEASASARDSFREMGRLLRFGLILGLIWSLLALLPALFAGPFLRLTAQEPMVVTRGGQVWLILSLSTTFAVWGLLISGFLEVLKRPMPVLLISVGALFANALFNYLLVRGWGPFPPMGAVGSAWATLLVRLAQLIPLGWVLLATCDRQRYGLDSWRLALPIAQLWRIQRLGFAVGASQGIEASAFTALTLMAGWLGAVTLGAFNIAFNVLALLFMLSLGIAGATTVLVGNAYGAGDLARARAFGLVSWGCNALLMLLLGSLLMLLARPITGLLTSEAAHVAIAAPLIAMAGFVHLFDGGQVIFAHGNRALGDSWVSTGLHICSYWLVMIPCGYLFSQPLGRGALGLFEAVIVASLVSCTLLALRFLFLTRAR